MSFSFVLFLWSNLCKLCFHTVDTACASLPGLSSSACALGMWDSNKQVLYNFTCIFAVSCIWVSLSCFFRSWMILASSLFLALRWFFSVLLESLILSRWKSISLVTVVICQSCAHGVMSLLHTGAYFTIIVI